MVETGCTKVKYSIIGIMSSNLQKLVFDIETVGVDFDSLDKVSREHIKTIAERYDKDLDEEKERLSFSPLTGKVVAIGVLNPDTDKGAVYLQTNDQLLARLSEPPSRPTEVGLGTTANDQLEEGITIETGSEKEILEKFWETAKRYNIFISFNGRAFDVPFLMIRSAILDVKPSKNLMSNRYLSSQPYNAVHVDLLDQLTFYGAVQKKFNMHFWTKAFGIKSPKEEGIAGDDVGRLYKEKKYLEIAKYNLGDLRATKELFERWEKYINI